MNNINQLIALQEKILLLIPKNKGVLTIQFYNGNTITARVKSVNTYYSMSPDITLTPTYDATISTFINDRNDVTKYDLGQIKDVS